MNFNKTPVTVLQETMAKICKMPIYDLIQGEGGSHLNTFTYRVSCDGLSATGTGRCKKDAKHEAAKALLETIAQNRAYPELTAPPGPSHRRPPTQLAIPDPPRSSSSKPFVDAVVALNNLWQGNKLNYPKYEAVSEVGPAHAKIFTIKCKLTNFEEIGVATTKKQAKHNAARKMLDKLTDLIPTLNDMSIFELAEEETDECYE